MAKRTARLVKKSDFTSWNFILFLTLAFILMVVLLGAIGQTSLELRTRAGLSCPVPQLPDATACPGGWKYTQNALNKCPTFVCEASPTK
jgi:hypothetical protein